MSTYAFRLDTKPRTIVRYHGAGYGRVWALCPRCGGGGEEEGEYGPKACSECGGRGEVDVGPDIKVGVTHGGKAHGALIGLWELAKWIHPTGDTYPDIWIACFDSRLIRCSQWKAKKTKG